jgi:hypothetical protein
MLARLLATVPFNVGPANMGVPASLHAIAGLEHIPEIGSHVPTAWHASIAVHTTEFEPVHTPATHASICVHALPSLHVVPSGSVGFEHAPVVGSHVPGTWHWSLAVQAMGVVPTQAPASHTPLAKQRSPVLHVVPLNGACEHVPSGLHVSRTHGLFVSHDAAVHVGASTPTSTVTSTEASAAAS